MMRKRGLTVGHVTIFRWIQRYALETNKRMCPHLRMSGTSYRIVETDVKVTKRLCTFSAESFSWQMP